MNLPALRFGEFSDNWIKLSLNEISEKIQDGTHFSPQAFESGDFKYLTSKNVKNGYIDLSNLTYITEKAHNEIYKRCDVREGDVLLTKDGTIGQVCVNTLTEQFSLLSSVAFIRTKNKFNNYFLYHLLLSPNGQEEINKSIAGQALKRITLTKINSYIYSFPSFQEQTKIANFLTAVDEKITQLTQKHDLLTQYKKGVMQQIFSQELRFKDDDGSDFPEWEEKTLDEVCICLDNKRKPLNDAERQTMQGEIPYWGANNIMDYVNDYLFDETIVLLAEDGGNFNEYKTRPIANISHGKCWVNNHTHVLKGKTGLLNEFLFYSLVHKNITGYVSGGTRAKLTKGEMLKILIDMPSPNEQTKIANFLTAIDDKITNAQTQLKALKQYKQGLLQQMFI